MWNIVGDKPHIRKRAIRAGAVKALERVETNFQMTDRGWQKGAGIVEEIMDNASGARRALTPAQPSRRLETGAKERTTNQLLTEADAMERDIRKNWTERVAKARARNEAALIGGGKRTFSTMKHFQLATWQLQHHARVCLVAGLPSLPRIGLPSSYATVMGVRVSTVALA